MIAAYPPPPQSSPGFPPQNYGQQYPPPPSNSSYPPPPPGGPAGHTPPPSQLQQPTAQHLAQSPGLPQQQQQSQQTNYQQQPQQQPQQNQPSQSYSDKPLTSPRTPSQSMEAQMMSPHSSMPGGAPAQGQFQGAGTAIQDDVGTFNGGSYRISHRDTNTILTLQLAMGCPIQAKPGQYPAPYYSQRSPTPECVPTKLYS
jgi:hypothetical protein